jgi:Ca2+-binding RTX toxin-like protein
MNRSLVNHSLVLRLVRRGAIVGLFVLALGSVVAMSAAANSVPSTSAGRATESITPNDLKPPECAGMDLTNLVTGTVGTGSNDLILGDDGANIIDGGGGSDCILGGGGIDTLSGGAGDDVLIGGPGTDTCIGGLGSNSYYSCEVEG